MLSLTTSASGRFSRFAFVSSRKRIRAVAMRPGRITLTVTLSAATSRARVFDQPTNDIRNALDIARFGIGAITPDDELVITRPHLRARMPGRIRSVMPITDNTMALNCFVQASAAMPPAGDGGGPPVFLA